MAEPSTTPRRGAVVRLATRIGWSLSARVVAAGLQLGVVVLLARGLPRSEFALFASVNVVLVALVALNGFGIVRQIQLRRARDRDDPELPGLFSAWLLTITLSAAVWLVGTVALGLWDPAFLLVVPFAAWLWFEQVTTVWNALSLADGRPRDLMPSYLWRRLPVLLALVVAGLSDLELDLLLVWSLSSAGGAALAFLFGRRRQEVWARQVWPHGGLSRLRSGVDLAYWASAVGVEVRDLDVAVVSGLDGHVGALYGLPARLIKPMNLVTVATASVVFPVLARRERVTRSQLLLGCSVGAVPVTCLAGLVALAASGLPVLVGDAYADAVTPLRVLCLAAVVTGFGGLVMTFLQTRSAAVNTFTGRAVLAFGVLQVPAAAVGSVLAGATGAAVAAVACQLVLVSLLLRRALAECGGEGASTGGGEAGPVSVGT